MDKSLIRRLENGRYEIHELLRQYAEEKLRATPEQHDQATTAHAEFCARLLADRQADLQNRNQQTAAAEIALEIDNIRQAWPFRPVRDHDLLWWAGGGLVFFIELRGLWREFETAFTDLAQDLREELLQTQDPQAAIYHKIRLMAALVNQSAIELRLGNPQAAARLIDEQESLLQELEPFWPDLKRTIGWYRIDAWRGWCAYFRGLAAVGEGAYETAKAHLLAALPYLRATEMVWGIGGAELILGQVARAQGHYGEARAFFERSLSIYEEIGDRQQLASVLDNLGRLALLLGDRTAAAAHCWRSLALREAAQDQMGTAYSWRHLGEVALAEGDYPQAEQCYQRSLSLCLDIGHRLGEASCQAHLGELALLQGHPETAKVLLQASLTIRRQTRHRLGVAQSTMLLAQVLHELGERDGPQALIQESLALGEALGSHWVLAHTHAVTGQLAQVEQDLAGAEVHFQQALAWAMQLQAPPTMLCVLIQLAPLLIETGRMVQASQILATVLAHPAADHPTRARAREVQAVWMQEPVFSVPEPQVQADLDELIRVLKTSLNATDPSAPDPPNRVPAASPFGSCQRR
jgi:tetratricopeptide (TPR) repeat protein